MDDVHRVPRGNDPARRWRAAPARLLRRCPTSAKWGAIERKPMSSIRRKTAERLSQAWTTIPHVTQYDKADITELEKLRQRFSKRSEAAGGKLTITAFALKVIAAALKDFPQFNSSVDIAGESIVMKKYIHIGVAVDTDRGLLVPVIRDVDKENRRSSSTRSPQLAEKAKAGKLTLDDMQGGSFTISNLGGIGGTDFTPIVNWPEVAILGLSRARRPSRCGRRGVRAAADDAAVAVLRPPRHRRRRR